MFSDEQSEDLATTYLTKSFYLQAKQCHKLIWLDTIPSETFQGGTYLEPPIIDTETGTNFKADSDR